MEEQVDIGIDINPTTPGLESKTDSEKENDDPQNDTPLSIIFTNTHYTPKRNEIVISGTTTATLPNHTKYRNAQSINLKDYIISSRMLITVISGNRITAEIGDMQTTLATIGKSDPRNKRPRRKEFLVSANNGLATVNSYDEKHFKLIAQEHEFQKFIYKPNWCYECNELYTFRNLHVRSTVHLQTAYFSKIVSLKKEITVNSTEINVYFDPEFNVIQKWQITNQNKTLPLDLYLPLETNKQWLSVIFLHATQGLRMTSQRPIEFYPNYIQRVDMNLSTLRRGKNVSGIQLEVTKNDTMETLIPILYEIRKENGH